MIAKSKSNNLLSRGDFDASKSAIVPGQPVSNSRDKPTRKRESANIRVDLFQADQHMSETHAAASGDIVGVVRAIKQVPQPLNQCALKPQHLFGATGNHALGFRVASISA